MNKLTLLALTLTTSLMSMSALADAEREFSETYDFNSDGVVRVENINGSIEIQGWDRNQIQLEYIATADDKDDLERIEVDINALSSSFSVDVEYQKKKKKGWFGGWNSNGSGEVEFKLKVPHTALLKMIDSVNGNVLIEDVAGEIEAETVNGNIIIKNASSDVSADTTNGKIKVYMERFTNSQRIKADTTNGDIVIYIPENEGFRLETDTVNGDLSNDFGIKVIEGKYVGADMDGRYKNGNGRILLDTVNGDIDVLKK